MTLQIGEKYDYRSDTKPKADANGKKVAQKPILLAAAASTPTNDKSKPSEFKPWETVKRDYENINIRSDNEDRIKEWHRQHSAENPSDYVIIDKKKGLLKIYKTDGTLEKNSDGSDAWFEVGIGEQAGDDFITKDRHMTSAGVYTVNRQGTGKDKYNKYYGNNIFTLYTDRGSSGVAIHQIPIGGKKSAEEMKKLYDGNIENNRFSEGGINLLGSDFDELERFVKSGTKVYVLPEDSNNEIIAKNGQLNLVQKKFTGTVLTSRKNKTAQQLEIEPKTSSAKSDKMKEFAGALVNKKPELMKKLDIDNDTYNNFASLALGIAGQESNFGEGTKYWFKEHFPGIVSWYKNRKNNHSANSRGLTQMKIGGYKDPEVKNLLGEYGITDESLKIPTKSAIGTVIVLASMYKNELSSLRDKMQEQNVSKSDALLYLWQGKKHLILENKATPDKNTYILRVKKFLADNFTVSQTNKPTEVEIPQEQEQTTETSLSTTTEVQSATTATPPSEAETETEEQK